MFETLHALIGRQGETIAWWQMCLRGSVIFVVGLVYIRVAGERVFGKWGPLDIVLSVIIGSNLSRALTGNAPFGATLAATAVLIGLHTTLAYSALYWPGLSGWLKGRPTRLITRGTLDVDALRRHAVGPGDLAQALRRAGLVDAAQVEAAWLERDGRISVIGTSGNGGQAESLSPSAAL